MARENCAHSITTILDKSESEHWFITLHIWYACNFRVNKIYGHKASPRTFSASRIKDVEDAKFPHKFPLISLRLHSKRCKFSFISLGLNKNDALLCLFFNFRAPQTFIYA